MKAKSVVIIKPIYMPTRTVCRFIACLGLITGFSINSLRAQATPKIDSCKATEGGNPLQVTVTASVSDSAGAPISGATVSITCGTKSTTTTTNAAGNCSAGIKFQNVSTMAGSKCTVCVTPSAASKGSDPCCECIVAGPVSKPSKGWGPGEVALITCAVLSISWLLLKLYRKQLNVG